MKKGKELANIENLANDCDSNEDKILLKIENIEQNLRLVDNIFNSINTYWVGDSADAVQELYGFLKEDIGISYEFLKGLKSTLGGEEIRKLPGDIF